MNIDLGSIEKYAKYARFVIEHQADVDQILAAVQTAMALIKAADAAGLLAKP
jgi:hypothetical protein